MFIKLCRVEAVAMFVLLVLIIRYEIKSDVTYF